MSELGKASCEACRKDAPRLSDAEIEALLKEIPEWNLQERNGEKQIERQFRFRNFAQALAFTQAIGELAEQQQHHPAILTEWGRVTVTWWTHKIGGLHRNDFIMAARTDAEHARLSAADKL